MNKTISLLLLTISGFSYANSYQYNNNPYINNQYGNTKNTTTHVICITTVLVIQDLTLTTTM